MENLTTQLEDLFTAVRRADIVQVKRLLAANVSPNQCDAHGQTAMMIAAKTGHPDIIQLLCNAAANRLRSAQIFFDASTPVVSAATVPSVIDLPSATSVRSLPAPLDPIAAPTASYLPTFSHTDSHTEQIGLDDRAAYSSPTQAFKKQPDAPVSDGRPELEAAVHRNDVSEVQRLLKSGVSFRPANWYDTPVLVTAAEQGYSKIVQMLISAGANVNNGCDRLPLHVAAEHGHIEVVLRLLNSDAYIQATESDGRTALMAAAATGQLEIVQVLIAKGANANATCQGETALMLAAKNKHDAVCEFLYPYSSSQIIQRKITTLAETEQYERDIAFLSGVDVA